MYITYALSSDIVTSPFSVGAGAGSPSAGLGSSPSFTGFGSKRNSSRVSSSFAMSKSSKFYSQKYRNIILLKLKNQSLKNQLSIPEVIFQIKKSHCILKYLDKSMK